jgi:acetoacetate decarboxylase
MDPDLQGEVEMKETDILISPSMPIASPSYPRGPYRFIDREYMIITYESEPDTIRDALPEPLEPDGSNTVLYEFIKMPDSAGSGDYTESGVVIPALYKGEHVNFTAQMYLDDEPPISGGREIWGFPKKLGNPKLEVIHDTLTGRLHYADVLVAVGTMNYKHEDIMCDVSNHYICDSRAIAEKMSGPKSI